MNYKTPLFVLLLLITTRAACGDGTCDYSENQVTCCTDCGCSSGYLCDRNYCYPLGRCGDGGCNILENCSCADCPCLTRGDFCEYGSCVNYKTSKACGDETCQDWEKVEVDGRTNYLAWCPQDCGCNVEEIVVTEQPVAFHEYTLYLFDSVLVPEGGPFGPATYIPQIWIGTTDTKDEDDGGVTMLELGYSNRLRPYKSQLGGIPHYVGADVVAKAMEVEGAPVPTRVVLLMSYCPQGSTCINGVCEGEAPKGPYVEACPGVLDIYFKVVYNITWMHDGSTKQITVGPGELQEFVHQGKKYSIGFGGGGPISAGSGWPGGYVPVDDEIAPIKRGAGLQVNFLDEICRNPVAPGPSICTTGGSSDQFWQGCGPEGNKSSCDNLKIKVDSVQWTFAKCWPLGQFLGGAPIPKIIPISTMTPEEIAEIESEPTHVVPEKLSNDYTMREGESIQYEGYTITLQKFDGAKFAATFQVKKGDLTETKTSQTPNIDRFFGELYLRVGSVADPDGPTERIGVDVVLQPKGTEICGDTICNFEETCVSCSADCGSCTTWKEVVLTKDVAFNYGKLKLLYKGILPVTKKGHLQVRYGLPDALCLDAPSPELSRCIGHGGELSAGEVSNPIPFSPFVPIKAKKVMEQTMIIELQPVSVPEPAPGCEGDACGQPYDPKIMTYVVPESEPEPIAEEPTITPEQPQPAAPPLEKPSCTAGCVLESGCVPLGTRAVVENISSYCSFTGDWENQLGSAQACQNNYECEVNSCLDGECISVQEKIDILTSLIQSLQGLLKMLGLGQ